MTRLLSKINISLDHSNPNIFVSSQWQKNKNSPNKYYKVYRWILAIYFNFVVILSLITAEFDKNLVLYPIFLTNWNVILNGVSSIVSAFAVATHFHKVTDSSCMTTILKTSWLLSSLSAVVAISISLVYWPLIYYGRDDGLNDVLTHAVNAIILFIDLFINAHPPRYGHFIHHFVFGLIYALFSIIYTFLGGVNRDDEPFIYTVLNWKYKTSSAMIFALLTIGFMVFIHFVLTACIQLRIWIYKKVAKGYQDQNVTTSTNKVLNV